MGLIFCAFCHLAIFRRWCYYIRELIDASRTLVPQLWTPSTTDGYADDLLFLVRPCKIYPCALASIGNAPLSGGQLNTAELLRYGVRLVGEEKSKTEKQGKQKAKS